MQSDMSHRQNLKRRIIAIGKSQPMQLDSRKYVSGISGAIQFAKDPHVSFTNNRAERDLRMSKVKQKVSGCFRASEYAHAYCRISSYLQSMANKGYNPLIAIQIALAGEAHKVWGE